ncbi:uncharacterized protein [Heptranchias perlo]|uniref:uncharacterized protein isoform X2 n=1 Tax=Heptranchias perlo TaxID=212740 RepID=UPI00355A4395
MTDRLQELRADTHSPFAMSLPAKQDTLQWFEETQSPQLLQDGVLPQCFHGFTSRREAEELLQDRPLGCFLLRLSESQAGIVLSYSGTDRCRHFIIDQLPNGQYLIQGDQRLHNSVIELLQYHKKAPILPFVEYLTTACSKRPEIHYEEIGEGRRQKLNVRDVGEGAARGAVPKVPEDGAGSPSLPGAPACDPADPKTTHDARHWTVEGAASTSRDSDTYQERPEIHYEEIGEGRRQKLNVRDVGEGAARGAVPKVPEDGAGSPSLPGAPPCDPADPKTTHDARHWTVEGAASASRDSDTYQERPEIHYEEIGEGRRQKLNVRDVGEGAARGAVPKVPEDGAGSPSLPGAPPCDPADPKTTHDARHWTVEGAASTSRDSDTYQERPEIHYEEIGEGRRQKLNVRDVGEGAARGAVPKVPEDGAGSPSLPGAPPCDPADPKTTHDARHWTVEGAASASRDSDTYQERPEIHYEEIGEGRRQKLNVRDVGEGAARGAVPKVPEDGAGSPSLPGAPPCDPADPKTTHDARHWTVEGAASTSRDSDTYQERPEIHYEEIGEGRRQKLNVRDVGEGAARGAVPKVPEDGAGSPSLPGAPACDPADPKTTHDARHWTVEGAASASRDSDTYQEIPEARLSATRNSSHNLMPCPPEREVGPTSSPVTVTYASVNKAKSNPRHIYTEPGERHRSAMEETHTYADPAQARLCAHPDDRIAHYAVPQDLLPWHRGWELHHIYSELDLKHARIGNLYCPTPTKGPDPSPRGGLQPTAPPRGPPLPHFPPSAHPIYAHPITKNLRHQVVTNPATAETSQPFLTAASLELDDPVYGILPKPACGTPLSAPKPLPGTPPSDPKPFPGTPLSAPKPLPGTPLSAPKPFPGTPLSAPKPFPGTPLSAPKPFPGTPPSDPKPLPGTPLSAPKPLPGTPPSDPKPFPGTPSPSAPKPFPGTPPSDPKPFPGTPPSAPKPLPGTPLSAPKPFPGTPPSDPKPFPGTPSSAPKPLPGTPLSAPKPFPGTPPSDPKPFPGTPPSAPKPFPGTPPSAPKPFPGTPPSAPKPFPGTPPSAPKPFPGTPPSAPKPDQDENLYERVPEEYLKPPPFAPTRTANQRGELLPQGAQTPKRKQHDDQ